MKRKKTTLYCLVLSLQLITAFRICAQEIGQSEKSCASDVFNKLLLQRHPVLQFRSGQLEDMIYFKSDKTNAYSPKQEQKVLQTIPVVVHIVHNNGPENISDAQVIQSIQDLNEAFMNQGAYQSTNGVAVNIQFCLAWQDENGNLATGITRTVSSLTNMTMESDDTTLKNLVRWNTSEYLNIWLVNEIISNSAGIGVAGYSSFPAAHGNAEDGIVCEAEWAGSSTHNSKVLIHEVGHYLGLYHTFEGGCVNNNCLTDGDRVCDTPPDASTSAILCTDTINTCTTDMHDHSINNPFRPIALGGIGGQNDLITDYMDYGFLPCLSNFTQGQSSRMNIVLNGARASLLNSDKCQSPCPNPITVAFSSDSTNVTVGTTVNFTNTTTGAIAYDWNVNGINFSSSFNSSYLFNTPGIFIVGLTVFNGDSSCITSTFDTITVNCGAQASFATLTTTVTIGSSIIFLNSSTGATGYEWFIDGISQSNSANFTHTFNFPGGFMVYLVACNGICCDTSAYTFIQVGICTNKQTNQWLFGWNAGLDFNSGSPVPFSGSAMIQYEGCSSISDYIGNLLFYSDGMSVWDRNHQQMPNGFGLKGTLSTSQSALIVQQPQNDSLYYLFTLDSSEDTCVNGFQYSIINMNMNGGMGDVMLKNHLLIAPATEKQTAVNHCNMRDVWIICHEWNTNAFYAYLLGPSGIDTVPVISNAGSVHAGGTDLCQVARGCMKASPDGRKLALAKQDDYDTFELFDFNTSTGIVSNPKQSSTYSYPYGVEFSPDGSKLYGATFTEVYQFNALAPTQSLFQTSAIVIATPGTYTPKTLQLASNGKIYLAGSNTALAVINNPNAQAPSCAFSNIGVNLFPGGGAYGLPNLKTSYFNYIKPVIIGPAYVCRGRQMKFWLAASGCALDSNIWSLHGNAAVHSFTDSTITLDFLAPGIDSLFVENISACGVTKDTLVIQIYQGFSVDLGNDTLTCSAGPIILDAGAGYSSYLWQNWSNGQTFSATTPGLYSVTVADSNGCKASDTIQVLAINPPQAVNLGNDTAICSGGILVLNAGPGFSSYHWQNHSTAQTFTAYTSGQFYVSVQNECFAGSDTIIISLLPDTMINLGNDTIICVGTTLLLDAGNNFQNYQWQDGSNTHDFIVSLAGTYYVTAVAASGCVYHDTIKVETSVCNNISSVKEANTINIYPNPGSGKYIISGLGTNGERLEILNSLGQVVFYKFNIKTPELEIDISDLENGIYYMKLISEDTIQVKRIVMQKQ